MEADGEADGLRSHAIIYDKRGILATERRGKTTYKTGWDNKRDGCRGHRIPRKATTSEKTSSSKTTLHKGNARDTNTDSENSDCTDVEDQVRQPRERKTHNNPRSVHEVIHLHLHRLR